MSISIDIHKYNINDLVAWAKNEQVRFGLTVESDKAILIKIKHLVEMYTELDNSSGDFTLLWNEAYEGYNSAMSFHMDLDKLFGFHDNETEDGGWIFTKMVPHTFGKDRTEPLEDDEWEEAFGFIPKDLDEEDEVW